MIFAVLVIKVDQDVTVDSVRSQQNENDEVRNQQREIEAVRLVQALECGVKEV